MDLKKPRGTYTGHRALEPWEMDLLLKHYHCARAGLWAITMMLAGTRRGETLTLTRMQWALRADMGLTEAEWKRSPEAKEDDDI